MACTAFERVSTCATRQAVGCAAAGQGVSGIAARGGERLCEASGVDRQVGHLQAIGCNVYTAGKDTGCTSTQGDAVTTLVSSQDDALNAHHFGNVACAQEISQGQGLGLDQTQGVDAAISNHGACCGGRAAYDTADGAELAAAIGVGADDKGVSACATYQGIRAASTDHGVCLGGTNEGVDFGVAGELNGGGAGDGLLKTVGIHRAACVHGAHREDVGSRVFNRVNRCHRGAVGHDAEGAQVHRDGVALWVARELQHLATHHLGVGALCQRQHRAGCVAAQGAINGSSCSIGHAVGDGAGVAHGEVLRHRERDTAQHSLQVGLCQGLARRSSKRNFSSH